MDCTVVVVSRWFGGIKLGAGGLMRAYGGCAAQCLREASKVPLIDSVNVEFVADFSLLATLRSRLSALDATVTAEDFAAAGALMRVRLPAAHLPQLRQLLADLSRGRVELRQID
jgi:putative IMPACT (imprinted ancient) family translation regulator